MSGCTQVIETTDQAGNKTNNEANSSSAKSDAQKPVGSKTISSACTNDYYPISPTAKIDYKVSGVESYNYDLTQKEITENGFKEDRNFSNGIVITNNWICNDDGLRTAEFTNQGMSQNMKFEMETLKSEGVTIPKIFEAGKEWKSTYDVKVNLNAGKMAVNADGDVTVSSKIASMDEPLTVDGKEYKAARIDSDIKIVVSMNGRTTEAATVKISNWYAKGVGLVKQITDGTLGKQTVELAGDK
ncbi:MAG: hypothetical protein KF685_03760 [Acidobacteria bacterium]|nr:hypothetical protein [Acidobacteriota bacterium]